MGASNEIHQGGYLNFQKEGHKPQIGHVALVGAGLELLDSGTGIFWGYYVVIFMVP